MENQNPKDTSVIFPGGDAQQASSSSPFASSFSSNNSQALSLDPDTQGYDGQPQMTTSGSATQAKPQQNFLVRLAKRADVILAVLLILGSVGLVIGTRSAHKDQSSVNSQYEPIEIPLSDLQLTEEGLTLGPQVVTINGALVVAPSLQPSKATAGQIYFDQTTNQLAYFNGAEFIPMAAGVQSIGGDSGDITIGEGLTSVGGQLSNAGVLSVQGVTGDVTFTAGNGINIDGTTISSQGVLDVVSSIPSLTVAKDANGTVTLSGSGSGTVSSPGGTAGAIAMFTGSQAIADSIVTQSGSTVTVTGDLGVTTGNLTLGNALTVSNGGTGATSLTANGVIVGAGTGALTSVVAGGSGLCLLSTAGAPTFAACPGGGGAVTSLEGLTGVLTISNATGVGTNITIDDATNAAKGIASFNGTNFNVAAGAVNTIQDIHSGATPTFVGVNTNNITPSAALTVGVVGQTVLLQGTVTTITSNGLNNDIILNSADTIELQDNTNVTGNFDVSGTIAAGTGNAFQISGIGAVTAVGVNAGGGLLQGALGLTISGGAVSLNDNSNFATNINTGTSSGTITLGGASAPLVIDSTAFDVSVAGALSGVTTIATSSTINSQTISSAANFTGTVTIQGANALTLGVTGSSTGAILFKGATAASGTITLIGQANPTGPQTITLPNGSGEVCLTTLGNCAGTGSGITGGGNANRVAKFNAAQNIVDSTITDDGTNVTTTVDLIVQGGEATVGTAAQQGSLVLHDGNGETATIRVGAALGASTIISIPTAVGVSDTVCLLTLANCTGTGSSSTLQAAYDAGNTITTTAARDLAFTLDNNSNLTVAAAPATTGFTTFSLTDGSNATPPAQLVLVRNNDTNQPVASGLKVTSAAGGITTALDVSGTSITNAIAIGANAISGTNFSVNGGGAVTAVGVNAGAGLIQGTLGLTVSGAIASLNANSNFATSINTGTSNALVSIGGGLGTFALNTTNIDISAGGAISGATGISSSGTITFSGLTTDGPVYTASGVLSSETNLSVTRGGTGFGSTTAYGLLTGGTTSTGVFQNAGTGSSGQILQSNGASALPTWISASSACSDCLVQVPATTARNTVAPTANSVVALTVKGTTGTAANVLEVFDSTASPVRQAFFNSAGSLNVGQAIQPTANNTIDLGLTGTAFRTGYFGTSVITPLLDTNSAVALHIGTTNATSINLNTNTVVNGDTTDALVVKSSGNGTGVTILNLQQSDADSVLRMTDQGTLAIGNGTNVAGIFAVGNGAGGDFVEIKVDNVTANRTLQLPNQDGTFCVSNAGTTNCETSLQRAYNASTGGSTPEIKLDTTRNGIEIQDADGSGIGSGQNFLSLRGPNGSGLGNVLVGFGTQGNLFMSPSTNRVDLVDINQQGGGNVFTIDSLNSTGRVGIALTSTNNPAYTLDVGGDTNLATGSVYRINGVAICSASGCTAGSGSGSYIQNQIASQQSSSNFWISGTGRADVSLLAPAMDVAAAGTLSIGTATATGITLGSSGSVPVAINSGTGTIDIGTGAQARTLNLGTGAAVIQTINIGGTGANVIAVGNTQTVGSISLGAAMTGGTINIGGTGLQTGTITLGGGTGAQAVDLATGGTGAKAATLGSTASTSVTTIQGGTGTANGDINIGDQTTAGKIVDIGSVTNSGTGTVRIATATGAAQTVTVGSTGTGSSLTLNGGSGNTVLNATAGTVTIQTTTSGGINIQPVSADGTNIVLGTVDNVGTVLVLDEKTGSGDPSAGAANGGMYYNSNLKSFRCYEDGAWRYCNDPVGLSKGYNVSEEFIGTSSTTSWGSNGWQKSGQDPTSQQPDATNRAGQIEVTTASSSSGIGTIFLGGASLVGNVEPIRINGGETIEFAVNLANLSTAGEEFDVRIGLCDQDTSCDDGLYFEYDRNASANWRYCAANGSGALETSSSTAVATGWTRFKIVVNSAGTSVEYFVNGTSVGTQTTNIPTATNDETQGQFTIVKSAGTTPRTMRIDYFQFRSSFTTFR